MLEPRLSWARRTEVRYLKTSGYGYEGPIGEVAFLETIEREVIPAGMLTGMHRLAQSMEDFARANAPWTDRTGTARKELYGAAGFEGHRAFAIVSHGEEVHYGIWLENRWNGRYAIIGPTQQAFADKAPEIVRGEVELELQGRGSKFRTKTTGRFV